MGVFHLLSKIIFESDQWGGLFLLFQWGFGKEVSVFHDNLFYEEIFQCNNLAYKIGLDGKNDRHKLLLSVGLALWGLDEFLLKFDMVVDLFVFKSFLGIFKFGLEHDILSLEPCQLFLDWINLFKVLGDVTLKFGINFLKMFILRNILQVIVLCFEISFSQLAMNRLLDDGLVLDHDLIVVLL